jgi:DNA-3-methyladenine glycosylase II
VTDAVGRSSSGYPDPAAYVYLSLRDPVLAHLTVEHGRPDPFRWPLLDSRMAGGNVGAMALHIIGQQISTAAALTIHDRILAAAGVPALTADALSGLDVERLRAAGLSHAKARALLDLAQAQRDGRVDLDHMDDLTDEEAYASLVALRGVGPWSAQVFMINQLRRPDVLPSADVGLREAVRRQYRLAERPSAQDVEVRGRPWSPYRTYAAALLWASLRRP